MTVESIKLVPRAGFTMCVNSSLSIEMLLSLLAKEKTSEKIKENHLFAVLYTLAVGFDFSINCTKVDAEDRELLPYM